MDQLAQHIEQPRLEEAIRRFLYDQIYPDSSIPSSDVPLDSCPRDIGPIKVYHSAIARFFAPSDTCGAGGMCRERIRSNPDWYGAPRRDTVFIVTDNDLPGMLGMVIGRVLMFFSFQSGGQEYSCALVHWLVPVSNEPDDNTGMWVVRPEFQAGPGGQRTISVVSIDSVARGAHLLPVYGPNPLPEDFHFTLALDAFRSYFVNAFADHHTHEFLGY